MSKLTLNNVGDLRNSTTAAATINANDAAIVTAMEKTLSRDGTTPNTMNAVLDMNSQQIVNLPQPLTANSPLRLQDLENFTGGGIVTNIPSGGNQFDILSKNTVANYDVSWQNLSAILVGDGATGSGNVVLATSPTITTPHIASIVNTGTLTLPTSTDTLMGKATTDILTNKTYDTAGTGNVFKINGNSIGQVSGTGNKVLLDTSPVMSAPNIGAATATSVNKVTITAPATGSTLTIPDGVVLTGPAASGTAMTLGNIETVTGAKTFGSAGAVSKFKLAGTTSGSTTLDASATASGVLTLPAATDTLVGKATTDAFTNKTFNTAATGNVFQINGTTISSTIGSGAAVLATTPTLTTPVLGVATATSINKVAVTAPATSATLTITDGQTLSYQEGTWTPTLIGSTSGSWVLNVALGNYEKIGRMVTCRFVISATSSSSPLGNIQIGGLPFTSANTVNISSSSFFSQVNGLTNSASYTTFCGVLPLNSTVINVYESGSGVNSQQVVVARASATPAILGTIIYHV